MRSESSHNTHTQGLIKDSSIIILVFVTFYFIDVRAAAFIAVICGAMLLIRRIILDYRPGFIMGDHIMYNESELIIPKGVEVFDLGKVPAIGYLQKYTETVRAILARPLVFILRFTEISRVDESDIYILTEIIWRLQKRGIVVIFSDVGENLLLQFREFDIEQKLGSENICSNISDAFIRAHHILHKSKTK